MIYTKNDLKKIYKLATDIVKGCEYKDYKYLFIEPDGTRGTDTYRIGKYEGITFEKHIAIPLEVIEAIKSSKAEFVELTLNQEQGKEYIIFDLKNKKNEILFTIKLNKPNIQNPNFESIEKLKNLSEDIFEANTKELKEALIKANKISKHCIFEIYSKSYKLIVINDNEDEEIINISASTSTKPFKIALNIKYVLDYLNRLEDPTVKMYFCNSSTFVWFKEDKNNYSYILMPLTLMY